MATIPPYKFDLAELYQKAFGIKFPEYDIKNTKSLDAEQSKYGSSVYYKQDAIGRYCFMPVELGWKEDGKPQSLELGYPLIRIQSRKNVVETHMTERKGSSIEIISQDNWKIYIRGFMIDHGGAYPEEDIYKLKEVYERNESLELRSVLTDLFLVAEDRVVITYINFPEVKGIEHVKPYEIDMISDSIFDLEIS